MGAINSLTNLLVVGQEIDAVLEQACTQSRSKLTRRATLALIYLIQGGDKSFSNESLRKILLDRKLSTIASVKKDTSIVKSELLGLDFVKIERKISVVRVTPLGRNYAETLSAAVRKLIEKNSLSADLGNVLRWIFDSQESASQSGKKIGGHNSVQSEPMQLTLLNRL